MEEVQELPGILKRKRSSPSVSSAPPPQKAPKLANHLQINYIARQCQDDLPLLSKNGTIPGLLDVLSAYMHVLDRHESLASNLGARPLGPILIKRFEKCFDAPPETIASHSHPKDSSDTPKITWLEVVHFAQAHPSQFTLSTFSEGRKVCQFYYPQKQIRVQVSEEDFLFIKSGRCQDLIPPLPIWEDEEKELGTCEIVEKALREVTTAADMLAARTRQLSHRLKGRRMAIMERRSGTDNGPRAHDTPNAISPPSSGLQNPSAAHTQTLSRNGHDHGTDTANSALRLDLLSQFQSLPQNQAGRVSDIRRQSSITASTPDHMPIGHAHPVVEAVSGRSSAKAAIDPLSYYLSDAVASPSSIPNTQSKQFSASNSGRHNFSRPLAPGDESSQPYRMICQRNMESLPRGSRVMPPCDRCRRLKMDCQKNLTSCVGCTKKHARCHWKDVTHDEVGGLDGISESEIATGTQNAEATASSGVQTVGTSEEDEEEDGYTPLDDLEALGRTMLVDGDDDSDLSSVPAEDHTSRSATPNTFGHSPPMENTDDRFENQQPLESTDSRDEEGLEQARQLARQAGQLFAALGPHVDRPRPDEPENSMDITNPPTVAPVETQEVIEAVVPEAVVPEMHHVEPAKDIPQSLVTASISSNVAEPHIATPTASGWASVNSAPAGTTVTETASSQTVA